MCFLRKKTFCVGLTGGIGSGKTTVATLFSQLNVPVIDADKIAHQLAEPKQGAYRKIVSHFGQSILNPDKTINRKQLREFVFDHPVDKQWLEKLLHPMIRKTMQKEIKKIKAPYCICVIPLLAESSGIRFIDRVLVVDTPIDYQIERAKKRDGVTEEMIQKIIDSQVTQSTRIKMADDVIINTTDIETLKTKIAQLHLHYLQRANTKDSC